MWLSRVLELLSSGCPPKSSASHLLKIHRLLNGTRQSSATVLRDILPFQDRRPQRIRATSLWLRYNRQVTTVSYATAQKIACYLFIFLFLFAHLSQKLRAMVSVFAKRQINVKKTIGVIAVNQINKI